MSVSLVIETSKPNGETFRMAFKCNLHGLVSWVVGLLG